MVFVLLYMILTSSAYIMNKLIVDSHGRANALGTVAVMTEGMKWVMY